MHHHAENGVPKNGRPLHGGNRHHSELGTVCGTEPAEHNGEHEHVPPDENGAHYKSMDGRKLTKIEEGPIDRHHAKNGKLVSGHADGHYPHRNGHPDIGTHRLDLGKAHHHDENGKTSKGIGRHPDKHDIRYHTHLDGITVIGERITGGKKHRPIGHGDRTRQKTTK